MRNTLLIFLGFLLAACGSQESGPLPTITTEGHTVATSALPSQPSDVTLLSPTPAESDQLETPSPATTMQTIEATPTSMGPLEVDDFPDPMAFTWRAVIGELDSPIGLANASDGTLRLFIVEQDGRVLILKDRTLLPVPFLDIRQRVGSRSNEQGLLGLAFHPSYSENGYFFVNYTDLNGDTVIARFRVSSDNPDLADAASETQLLGVSQPFANHNGGMLAFGPDGYLYIGLGDGGSGGDPLSNGQSLNTLLGKILRIDVDRGEPYTIPADNPFKGGSFPEIWAFGLRNPWRFSFDRLTGDLYIGDVGQNQWEEIDHLPADAPGGANFGWRYYEGSFNFQGSPPANAEFVMPIAEYGRDQGCSVTGGAVYRGSKLPDWYGVYLYGDFCSGRVWGLLQDASGGWISKPLFEKVGSITSFGEDEAGELYLADRSGTIYVLDAR